VQPYPHFQIQPPLEVEDTVVLLEGDVIEHQDTLAVHVWWKRFQIQCHTRLFDLYDVKIHGGDKVPDLVHQLLRVLKLEL
jgi:hypothetical protein